MIIFPAIDLSNGEVVRLQKGKFNKKKTYTDDFTGLTKSFVESGAKWIHVVDLDGALTGKNKNEIAIKKIIINSNCNIQLGGGIRDIEGIKKWLDLGVKRVVIGTAAVKNKDFIKQAVTKFPGKIAVGLDLKGEYVAVDGWTKLIKEYKASYYFKKFSALGVSCIIYTDIDRDGLLNGPNIAKTIRFAKLVTVPVVASGGVSSIEDLEKLKKKKVYGVIVGKALYENKIKLNKLFKI